MYVHLDKLRGHDAELYRLVAEKTKQDTGICEVEPETFEHDVMQRLITFAKAQKYLPVPVESLPSDQELLQKATDQAAGFARLQQYADMDEGLAQVPENASLIDVWLTKRGLPWSSNNVDAAVSALKNVLTWRLKVEAPPPPAEVLKRLSDGTTQLPIDVAPSKAASVAQLKDWLARTREATGRYIRPRGSFGSSL